MTRPRLLRAGRLLGAPELPDGPGGVLVCGARIERVVAGDGAVARLVEHADAELEDLGERVLAPGLVNAHAHLELGFLADRLPGDAGFAAWVRALVAARAEAPPDAAEMAVRAGLATLLAGGTTCVGDIDASDAWTRVLASPPDAMPRVVRLRELLDARAPARLAGQLARLDAPAPGHPLVHPGLSPHAPMTVGPELLRRAAEHAAAHGWPVQVHWAESKAEREWLLEGTGPFRAFLGPGPGASGLALLDAAGLLRAGTSLVHANHPEPGELERVVRAGVALVHCPGTHRFFGRAPIALAAWERAGVRPALGTDSLASNTSLDLRTEMSLVRLAEPALDPERIWEAATRGGARALGMEGRIGTLAPGAWADLVAFEFSAATPAGGPAQGTRSRARLVDLVTAAQGRVARVWVAGRAVPLGAAAGV